MQYCSCFRHSSQHGSIPSPGLEHRIARPYNILIMSWHGGALERQNTK